MMDLAESSFTFTFPSSQFITTLSPSTRLPLLHTRVEIFPLPFFFFIFPSPSRASLSLHYVFGPSFLPTPSDHLLPSPAFIQPVPFNPARPDSRHPAFRPHPAYRATRIPQSWSPTCSLQSDDRPSLCPLTQGMFIRIVFDSVLIALPVRMYPSYSTTALGGKLQFGQACQPG